MHSTIFGAFRYSFREFQLIFTSEKYEDQIKHSKRSEVTENMCAIIIGTFLFWITKRYYLIFRTRKYYKKKKQNKIKERKTSLDSFVLQIEHDDGRTFWTAIYYEIFCCWDIYLWYKFWQRCYDAVSYTHLDVYKRQEVLANSFWADVSWAL